MTKVACHSVKNGHIDGGDDTPLVIATVSSKGGETGSQVNIHQEMETHINLSRLVNKISHKDGNGKHLYENYT